MGKEKDERNGRRGNWKGWSITVFGKGIDDNDSSTVIQPHMHIYAVRKFS